MGAGRITFWVLILLLIVGSYFYRADVGKTLNPDLNQLLSVNPTAASAVHEKSPVDHYKLFDSGGTLVGAAFLTAKFPPKVSGYGGEINCLVGIAPNGEITGVKVISHKETSQYLHLLEEVGFFKGFEGLNVRDGLKGIDAVTSATVSSEAIIKDVKAGATLVAREIFKTPSPQAEKASWYKNLFTWKVFLTAFILAFSIAAFNSRSRTIRSITLILSVVIVGVILNVPLTIGNLTDAVVGRLPQTSNIPLLLVIVFAVFSAVMKGPIYCAHVCPFGALQDGAAMLTRRKIEPEQAVRMDASRIRYLILLFFVIAYCLFDMPGSREVEPFSACFSKTQEWIVKYQVITILAVCVFVRRAWCRYFCPTGLCLDMISQVGKKVRRFFHGFK